MKKRILFLFMAFFIASAQPVYCYADAASLTIMGSIGTEGLSIASYAGMLPYAAAVVGGVLVASGINVYLTNASQQAGKTKTEFIKDSIKDYCSAAKRDTGEFVYNILSDIKVGNQGAIEIGSRAGTQIKQLINYLNSQDKIFDTSQAGSGGSIVKLGGLDCPALHTGDSFIVTTNGNRAFSNITSSDYFTVIGWRQANSTSVSFVLVSGVQQTVTYYFKGYGNQSKTIKNTANGYFYNSLGIYGTTSDVYNSDFHIYVGDSIVSVLNTFDGNFNVGSSAMDAPPDDSFTSAGIPDVGPLSPSAGDTTVLNPDILDTLTNAIQGIANANLSIEEYLRAIGIAIDGLSGAIKVRDTDTDVIWDVTIPTIDVFDPDIDTDTPSPSGVDPAIDPNAPADVDVEVDGMKMDLKSIFPFCIPFDVVDMIKLLDAEPVAPSYTVNWQIPIINRALTFEVDLSPFNSVAALLRNLEIIVFCIGLAMVTRSMFIRG